MLIVAVLQADPRSGLAPVRYPDYSTFPPTYSLLPPTKAPLAHPAPMSKLELPRPILEWASAPSAKLVLQPPHWRLSNYPDVPVAGGQQFDAASYALHPRVRYRTLSASISDSISSSPISSSRLRPFGTESTEPQLPLGTTLEKNVTPFSTPAG